MINESFLGKLKESVAPALASLGGDMKFVFGFWLRRCVTSLAE
jgi:hypothetical protein